MWKPFFLVISLCVVRKCEGLRYCKSSMYKNGHETSTYYSCSSNQYCCHGGCCTSMTRLWYFWTMMLLGLIFLVTCWWYYRYRYRPRQVIVQTVHYSTESGQPMVVIQPIQRGYARPPGYGVHVNTSGNRFSNPPQVIPQQYFATPYGPPAGAPPPYFEVVKPENKTAPPPQYN